MKKSTGGSGDDAMIAIGTSRGGLDALRVVLKAIPASFSVPIVVVQHRGRGSGEILSRILQRDSALRVHDAEDGEPLRRGRVYLAPADYHLLVDGRRLRLSVEGPVRYSRPSIDILFDSMADAFRERATAVVLTGANDDGARGSARVRELGGTVVVQDPATAEAPEMPTAVIQMSQVDHVLPLDQIGSFLAVRFGEKNG
jgi:two-component system, chemotaxis family, protein-glutamate methylesterase/glutaminase